MNYPNRDFRYLITIVNFNHITNEEKEKLIEAGEREPLTELLAYYKNYKYISSMSENFNEIFSEIVKRSAENNSYPAFLLPRFIDYPELICSFIEGFERYLYNLRFSYESKNNTIYLDSVPGVELELQIKDKLYIFRNSDLVVIGLDRMYFNLKMSKSAELLLDQYRNLYSYVLSCPNKCSSNSQYCIRDDSN